MKAFEEWALQGRTKSKIPHISMFPSWAEEFAAKDAWRAALEWFYGNLGYSEEHEELKELIEQELES